MKGTDAGTVGTFEAGDNTAHLKVAGAALNTVTVSGSLAQAVVSTDPAAAANLALGVTAGKDVLTLSVNTAVDTTLTVTKGTGSTKEITTLDASASNGGVTYDGTVSGGTAAPATIKTGSGKDDVTVVTATSKTVGAVVNAVVDTAGGDDKVTIDTTGDGNVTVNTGMGDDVVTVTDIGSGSLTINLGEGKDTIDLGTTALRSNFRIDGQAGDDSLDTLKMAGKSLVAQDYALIKSVVSNIDMLSFTGTTAAVDASQLGQFKILGFADAGGTVTSAVAAQSLEIAGGLTVTAKDYDATVSTAKVYGDALTIKAIGDGTVIAKGSSVNLSVDPGKDGDDLVTSTLTGDFKTATVTLAASQDFTDGKASSDNKAGFSFDAANAAETTALTISGSGNAIVTGGGKLATIDASGLSGAYTVEAGGNKVGDIYGGLVFEGNAGVAETIKLGAGADKVIVASTYGKMDTIAGFDAVKESNNKTSVTDTLTFGALDTSSNTNAIGTGATIGALAEKVVLSANATTLDLAFVEAANASAATSATIDGKVVTFQFGGDTYLFQDVASTTVKALDSADLAVKLVGLVDFSKDFDAFVA